MEQIFLNGSPVIGFGDSSTASGNPINRIGMSFLLGSIGGAAVGALVGKGVGAVIGAAVGGLGGSIIGGATAHATGVKPESAPTAPGWHRLSTGDQVVQGQPLAIAISSPNGLSPDVVKSIAISLANWHWAGTAYPPGSQGPVDWPAEETRGPGAYRIAATAGDTDSFHPSEITKILPPVPLTVEAWVKS